MLPSRGHLWRQGKRDSLVQNHILLERGSPAAQMVHDLGNGVVLAVVVQLARPAGIAGHVQQREGWVYVWVGGLIARLTVLDIDEARAAGERLALGRSRRGSFR